MKNKIPSILAASFIFASLALAGTYSITTTTAQDNRLERHRIRVNKATCHAAGLPNNCTQAQARAVTPGVNIYSDVADLIDRLVVKGYVDALRSADRDDDTLQFCAWWRAATNEQQNTACALAGLPNGCEVCPGQ